MHARWLARVDLRKVAAWSALALSVLLVLVVLTLAWPTLRRFVLVLAVSVVFAYVVGPQAELVRRRASRVRIRLPQWAAVLLVYAFLAIAGVLAWYTVIAPHRHRLANVAGIAREALDVTVKRLVALDPLRVTLPLPSGARSLTAELVTAASTTVHQHAEATLTEFSDHVLYARWLWLVPVITFALLTAWPAFRRSAVRILPEGHLRWRSGEFLEQVNAALAGYTRAQLLACTAVGVTCAAGFALLGLPSPVPLGLLAGALEFFPVIGPLATALLAASLVSGMRLVLLLAFLATLRIVQDYVIYPRLIGRRMHLSALAVILAVVLGAELGGLVGVFCAVPTVGIVGVALRQYREYREVERLVRQHGSPQPSQSAAVTDEAAHGGEPGSRGEVAPAAPSASKDLDSLPSTDR